jgi:hypothetical protein
MMHGLANLKTHKQVQADSSDNASDLYSRGPRFKSQDIRYPIACDFPQSFQANVGIIPQSDHESFIQNPFKFIFHVPTPTVHSHQIRNKRN